MDKMIVLNNRPPSDGGWRRIAPVHRPELEPVTRDRKRFKNVQRMLPTIEECPLYDIPVALQPRSYQLQRSDHLEIGNILSPKVLIISQLGGYEHSLTVKDASVPGISELFTDNFPSRRVRVYVSRLDMSMPRTARIARSPKSARDAMSIA